MTHTTFDSYKCYIIAEIGIHHAGVNSKARKLINLAQRSRMQPEYYNDILGKVSNTNIKKAKAFNLKFINDLL